jgi:hypothetical protein
VLVSDIDLVTDPDNRPEARQLRYSLEKYMTGAAFKPGQTVDLAKIQQLINE